MEKRTPHYSLAEVQTKVRELKAAAFTKTALIGGFAMRFTVEEMVEVVCSLTRPNLYKSMTTHADHTVWQDVYHASTEKGAVYIKVTMRDHAPVIQFKEK